MNWVAKMRNKWIPLIVAFIIVGVVIGLIWIQNPTDKELSSILLECVDESCPFKQKSFDEEADLKKFQRAISKADKIKGEIDLVPMFWMHITFKDGTRRKYVLNINEEYMGRAILVNVEKDSSYFIPKSQADLLRPIVYNE